MLCCINLCLVNITKFPLSNHFVQIHTENVTHPDLLMFFWDKPVLTWPYLQLEPGLYHMAQQYRYMQLLHLQGLSQQLKWTKPAEGASNWSETLFYLKKRENPCNFFNICELKYCCRGSSYDSWEVTLNSTGRDPVTMKCKTVSHTCDRIQRTCTSRKLT